MTDSTDPGTLICQHEHRIHYLGGGIYVCFACWARLLLGVPQTHTVSPAPRTAEVAQGSRRRRRRRSFRSRPRF